MAEPRVLKLQSPAYGDPIFYKWPLVNTKKHDEASEICDTIRLVCEDFPELKFAVENFILKDHDGTDYDSMNHICQRYNKAIKNILALWKGRAPPPHMFKPPKKELLRHIINLCFSHAIKEPEKLNIYEPFSPEVYGETSFDMVAQILEECKKSNEETFIDLGSGVGQVVLQAAASNQFKECFGVEKAETPAMYAKAMDEQFRKWMDWFGKTYTDFTLEKGDFLEDKWTEIINNSGFVFVNNFAFGPLVNHHLKERFQQMKEGAQIISSREYCPLNFKFNKRNLSELGAMMRVTELKPKSEEQTVSWTGNVVSYYLHVVDRTRLEKYFSILKKRKEGRDLDEDELSLYSESNVSVDTGKHEETLEENLDELYLGTTTRHQWQVLNETLKQSRNDVKDEDEANTKKKKKKKKKIKDDLSDPSSISTTSITQKSGNIQMKDKILQKYGHQKVRKAIANLPNTSPSLTSSTSTANKSLKGRKKNSLYLAASSPSSSETDTSPEDDEDVDDDEEWVPPVQQDKNNNKLKEKKTKKKHLITASTTSKKKKESIKSWQTNNSSKESKGNADTTNKKASSTTKKQKDTAAVKTASAKSSKKKNKEGPSKDFFTNLDRQVDEFYDSMKVKAKEFIRRINTEEYANRLQTMIECEQTKKKLLQREVTEMEQTVQQLITTGLTNFSNRLVELDLAVKTPLELLSTSTQLAEKRQDLENKVLNMEVEVFNLEEKYKNMCVARNVKNESLGLPPIEEVMPTEQPITCQELENHRNELTSQLCGSILSALNHRKNLIDKQSSLNEQISILEKITSPTASLPNEELDSYQAEEMSKDERPLRPRPVAYVPPRMIGEDQNQIVISPEGGASQSEITPTRRGRGRPRKEQEEEQEEKNSFVVTRDMLTSATERNTSQVLEERAPIVFPNSLKNEETDEISKKFLQASSKLLQSSTCEMSSHKGKWKPLQEIDSFCQISSSPEHVTNHMILSSATIPSVIKETNPSHPKLKDIEQRNHNTSTITTRPPNEQKPPDEEIRVSEEPKIMEPPIQPPSIALPSIPPPPTKILIHDQAPVTSQHLQKVHKFNIYDNLHLSFLQQRDFLNRAPIVTTHAITQRQPSATVTVSACSKPTITPRLPSMSLQSSGPLTTPFSMDSLAQSSAITMSQQQLHRIQNAAQNSIPIIHHPSTSVFFQAYPHGKHPINVLSKTSKETDATKKPKRGRKRKTVDESVDMSSNIIVPGKHVKAHKQKRKDSTCTKNNNSTIVDFKREVEDHFKTSLDQIHQQFHNRQQTTTQQPVMSSSSIKNIQIPLRVQPSDALAPSLHQQRPSNLDILKQAAFANLPERSTTTSGVLYQPLSNPLATSSVSTTECKPAATLKTVQVAKTIIPVNTTGPNSLYALHNRIVEHPVASSLNRTKNAPSFIQQPISTIAHVKNQTKSKKSKKEIQLPIQVIPHKLLAAAPLAQSGHLHPVTHFIRPATHDSNLLRSMLLTSPQEATSAHKLLVMNPPSTVHAHHPLAVAGASKPDQRLMILPEHLQATRSPVVFLPSPAAPALPPSRPASIIVDASRPSSSNASPTFPPPKPS